MSNSKRRAISVQLLRRGLLVMLVAFVVAVAALYMMGRMSRPTESRATPELGADRQGRLVLSGKGFDYGLTQGDREVFRIQASRILSDRENNYELEGVKLTLQREDGSVYHLVSDTAVYNLDTQAATFEGSVRFSGPRDVVLTAEGLELREEGALLVSSSPVQFEFLGRYAGTADRLRINPKRDLFILAGNVEVDTLPGEATPVSLRCRRFTFERNEHQLRAEGQVVFRRGEDTLEARRLSVILSDDDRHVEFVQARWNVRGRTLQSTADGQLSTVELQGRELSVVFEPLSEQPQTAELTASASQPALLAVTDQTGLRQQIRSRYLVGDFESGALTRAQAFDVVEIVESLALDPSMVLRTACADRALARLSAAGELRQVDLEGTVLLQDGNVQAFGDRAQADLRDGQMELVGEPAWLFRNGEQLDAPRIVYDQVKQAIVAEDRVRAVLSGGQQIDLAGDPATQSEPIRIQAQRAEWSGQPSTVTFRGQVRAWQGENFLISDELKGETESSRVTAIGSVKTVWRPESQPESSATEVPPEPLEVTAGQMVYDRPSGLLVYTGNARAIQLRRTLRCQEIRVRLAADGSFEEMHCEGTTHFVDDDAGNTVTGERATYRPGERTVRVEGSPVTLRDRKGTEIQGKILIYDFDTATARIQSEPPTPLRPIGES